MVKNRKVTVPAGMMRRRVVFSPKKVRKAKQFEWIPTMAMPDEEHHMFPKDEEEEEEQEEEAETFERAGVFPFKELPSEIRDMIYNYALNKRGKKKPDLLDALRGQSVLREAALNIYYQTNSFTVGLLKHSPLGPDIESNEAVAFMKDIKVHVPHLSPITQLSTVLFSANNIRHLTLTTPSSHSLNLVALRYLPSFKNLISLAVEADSAWCDNRFHVFGFPLGQEHPVSLLDKMLGENGVCHEMSEEKMVWQWTSQARAADDKSGAILPFTIRSPKLSPKRT